MDIIGIDYSGDVSVKSINVRMFNGDELKQVLTLVDELLLTKMSDRGEKVTFNQVQNHVKEVSKN